MTVTEIYQNELAAKGYVSDPAQLRAIVALERCASEWATFKKKRSTPLRKLIHRPDIPRGVYMYGGVGRGKSFLMDCFFNANCPERQRRSLRHTRQTHRQKVPSYLF